MCGRSLLLQVTHIPTQKTVLFFVQSDCVFAARFPFGHIRNTRGNQGFSKSTVSSYVAENIYIRECIHIFLYIYNYKFKCGYICKLLQARRNVVGYGLCCSGAPYCETKDLFVCQHGIFFARLRGPKAVTSHNQLLYARRQKVLLIARTRIL